MGRVWYRFHIIFDTLQAAAAAAAAVVPYILPAAAAVAAASYIIHQLGFLGRSTSFSFDGKWNGTIVVVPILTGGIGAGPVHTHIYIYIYIYIIPTGSRHPVHRHHQRCRPIIITGRFLHNEEIVLSLVLRILLCS